MKSFVHAKGFARELGINDLEVMCKMLQNYPNTNLVGFDTKILNILTGGSTNKRQGVHWIIKDIGTNPSIFGNKTITFEVSTPNYRGTTSYIDAFVQNSNLKIEYKWGEGSIDQTSITSQFVERDLFSVSSLDEIQWRIKDYDLTKQQLVAWMQASEALNTSHIFDLFEDFRLTVGYDKSITTLERLIEFLNMNDDWYNVIFKQF